MQRLLPIRFINDTANHTFFIQTKVSTTSSSDNSCPIYGRVAFLKACMHIGKVLPIVPSKSKATNLIMAIWKY